MQAYQQAIERAVERLKAAEGEVHALDMGCGTGLFAAMAARAGASSVVACDLHDSLCTTARKVTPALNKHELPNTHHPQKCIPYFCVNSQKYTLTDM